MVGGRRSATSVVHRVRHHWSRYGTARIPGPDLGRMPIGFDLANVSIAEGLRAAVATGLVLLVNIWFDSPALTIAAFAANLTCFCDTGGPVRHRVPALAAFTVAGAALWSIFGLLHHAGWLVVIAASALVVLCTSMVRVWGLRAQAVGNILTVVLALAADRPLDLHGAALLLAGFLAGGAWAILLTIGIWRIHPLRPAGRAVGDTWRLLSSMARDLVGLAASDEPDPLRWDAHARSHRRSIRQAMEESRILMTSLVRSPGPMSPESARLLLSLEAAEQVFGALIALSDLLEADAELRPSGLRMLRRLRPALVLLSQDVAGVSDRVEPAFERMQADVAETPRLQPVVGDLVDRLRLAFGLKREQSALPAPARGSPAPSRLDALWQPLRSNLTWDSAVLRHATRASVLTAAAVGITLVSASPYAHWLTITVVLTMQPYFAATWQRALERVGGTLVGAAIGAALAFVPPSPLTHVLLLIPLCVLGFSVRQVSYGAYIACLTPLTVLLFEVAEPGHSEWVIAAWRALYTVGGGLVAVLACMVLWPSWEPDRTRAELRAALRAHAAYAAAVLDLVAGQGTPARLDDARRKAGLASNNLEASLSRALQEPKARRSARLEALLASDAALRRLGAGFVTLRFDPGAVSDLSEGAWDAWRRWLPGALDGFAEGAGPPGRMPEAPTSSTLARLGRGVELLGGLVADLQKRAATADP